MGLGAHAREATLRRGYARGVSDRADAPNPYGFPPLMPLRPGAVEIAADAVRWFPHPPRPDDRVVPLLHGLGSSEEDLLGLAPALPRGLVYAAVRGVLRCGPGFAWLQPPPLAADEPELLAESARALEEWIAATCPGQVVGAIGFSQGAMLALQLLRRDPESLDWVVQLSGAPFPAPLPGDAELERLRPPAFWGHGGMDPLFTPEAEAGIREWMSAHTSLTEVRSPMLGHGIDEQVLAGAVAFIGGQAAGDPV